MKNQSLEVVFVLLGLTGDPQLQILIYNGGLSVRYADVIVVQIL